MSKTFYLIDGHAQIFRAYYAPFQLSASPSGEPVKATHTFTQMLLGILRDREPDYVAMALDVSDSSTERTKVYPEYKANRDETPEDLHPQVERICQITEVLGIPIYRVPGWEADDILATIAQRLAEIDVELILVSRDKDLYQLITDRVKLWDPGKDEVIDAHRLEEKHGFTPEQAVEIQVLTGDSIDNIPGIHGVGPKTAAKLILKYGSADAVFEHVEELTPKLRENVLAFREFAPRTRELVTLRRDIPLDFDLESCVRKPVSVDSLRGIFEELGFRRLLAQLEGKSATTPDPTPAKKTQDYGGDIEILGIVGGETERHSRGQYTLVDTPEEFEKFLRDLRAQEVFAIDTETTSLQAVDCDLVGIAFSWSEEEAYYLPLRSRASRTLPLESTLAALKPTLEDPAYAKWGQNLKYDIQVLRTSGIELRGVAFDSMIGSYLLHPERRSHGLDALARDLLGHATIPISELIGKGKKQGSLLDVDTARLTDYAGEDADITWRLCSQLRPQIEASPMHSLFAEVEQPLVEVLADMEYTGIELDVPWLQKISQSMGERVEGLKEEIFAAAGRPFTVDSPKQLAEVLFDDLGLRVVKKTKTSRSTDAEVLATLREETAHPLPALVLQYRELNKLRGTYVDPLPLMVSKRTGRLHPGYHQTVAATGRLSSSEPNIQNIPIRTEQGREIRKAFIAKEGHVLVCADYSQIELRILAHLAKDAELLQAFHEDRDIHASVAAQVAGIPIEDVSGEQRNRAKAINFGIIYGQGAFGLAKSLGIPQREAAEFIKSYKAKYSGIVEFMARCIEQAEESGGVSTLLGRRRPIPEIHAKNRNIRALGERLAVNTVVQGTAADMIKVAMVRVHSRLTESALPGKLLVQVHDELVLEVPQEQAHEHVQLVSTEMKEALPLDVPIRVDVGWGQNWLEAKK